jgi:hypothetical protein
MRNMPDETRHESEDLADYEVLESSDTLEGPPGDDPLDRGIVPPDRWSSEIRSGSEERSESLDELLAEEEPDISLDPDGESSAEYPWDENATRQEVSRDVVAEGADPRAGRLAAEDEDFYAEGDSYLVTEDELIARDAGIDGGGATAEEAAMHVIDEDDEDEDEEDEEDEDEDEDE